MASLTPGAAACARAPVEPDLRAVADAALTLLRSQGRGRGARRFRWQPAPTKNTAFHGDSGAAHHQELLLVNPQKFHAWFATRIAPALQSGARALCDLWLAQGEEGSDTACATYFAALLCYGELSGRSPVGLPPKMFANDMPLQSLAHETLWPAPSSPVIVPPHLASRLLYANPVCFLAVPFPPSVRLEAEGAVGTAAGATKGPTCASCNLMTISWLTATDNHGNFFMSMNHRRASSDFLRDLDPASRIFTLSVACGGCEDMLLAVGTASARRHTGASDDDVTLATKTAATSAGGTHMPQGEALYSLDKVLRAGVEVCPPGWGGAVGSSNSHASSRQMPPPFQPRHRKLSRKAERKEMIESACNRGVVCVKRAAAHIVARVTSIQRSDDGSHNYVHAEILRSFVRPQYWRNSDADTTEPAIFAPRGQRPGLLKFLGSKTFGVIR
jgi:hypothetical protein